MKFITYSLLFLLTTLITACRPATAPAIEAFAFQPDSLSGWGLVTADGQVVVPAGTYPLAPSAVVNQLFSVPDSTGQRALYHIQHPSTPVCPRRFARIGHFFEEVAPAQETLSSPILLIDPAGNTRFSADQHPSYRIVYMHNFSEGRALVATQDGKYGYINTRGEMVIPPIYVQAFDFSEGTALVALTNAQGEWGYQLIDTEGNVLQTIQQSRVTLGQGLHNGLLRMRHWDSQQTSYLNHAGQPAFFLPAAVTDAFDFQHNRAVIQTTAGMGVINRQGEIVIHPQYDQLQTLADGNLLAQYQQRWALLSETGKRITDFTYDKLTETGSPQRIIAQQEGKAFFVSNEGTLQEGERYAHLLTDLAALHRIPQSFLQESPAKTPQKTAPEKVSTQQKALPNHTTAASQPTQQAAPVPASQELPTDQWKSIAEKSPFFAEAQKVFSGKLSEPDARNRRMILNYVEHFRTAYTTKDIDFLEQTFSENALIIVGKVIQSGQRPEGGYLTPDRVLYNVKSKRAYLDRLKQVFQANRKIEVKFSQFRILRHPTQPGIYGVSLRQGYTSDLYSDDGYLFLLWDFRDPAMPKIHVRTWQPSMLDNHTPLPEEEVFSIQNFHLN